MAAAKLYNQPIRPIVCLVRCETEAIGSPTLAIGRPGDRHAVFTGGEREGFRNAAGQALRSGPEGAFLERHQSGSLCRPLDRLSAQGPGVLLPVAADFSTSPFDG